MREFSIEKSQKRAVSPIGEESINTDIDFETFERRRLLR